ncbi:hypothetical protein NCCP2716_30930 [Sporosarcina sp. NCCP-2716]|uniref:lysozyme inhibitor LprI family protein n=1 Tax=Sporosarcina sp. NCCP-2716 TaxID=2943679 RepID=UPI00203E3434|nr:lysozyme inhibitor LprI family protein [Sporosarcina sp. NCCP-2716]GKV70595.1 hypothetical protein NCCP2716_30930 [Sporosarcina sp. NCCP-2716]
MNKRLLTIPIVVFMLAGCSGGTSSEAYENAMESGEQAVQDGKYDKARDSFYIAREEAPKDEFASRYSELAEKLEGIRKSADDGNWQEAGKKAADLLKQDKLPNIFRTALEELQEEMQNGQSETDRLLHHLDLTARQADDGNPKEAASRLDSMLQSEEWKTYGRSLEKDAEEVKTRIAAAEKRQLAEAEEKERLEKEEADKRAAEEKKQQAAAAQQPSEPARGTQGVYMKKLAAVEAGLSDLDHLYTEGLTELMIQGEQERYKRWDDMLNEIYGVLKKQLSPSEMEALRQKQRNWIVYRDNQADAARKAGTAAAERNYHGTLAYETEQRCYELVRGYME